MHYIVINTTDQNFRSKKEFNSKFTKIVIILNIIISG